MVKNQLELNELKNTFNTWSRNNPQESAEYIKYYFAEGDNFFNNWRAGNEQK